MILRGRRFKRGALELTMPRGEDRSRHATATSPAPTWLRTPRATRSSKSSCSRPTRPWPRLLEEAGLPFLRRVHRQPRPAEAASCSTEFVTRARHRSRQPGKPLRAAEAAAEVAGKPREHAVNYAVLRSMQRAVYSPEEEGHYALASDCYCHFTSPIRRYPDLTIHRLLDRAQPRQEARTTARRLANRWASIAANANSGPRRPSAS